MIREATAADFDEWLRIRVRLYPDHTKEVLLAEIQTIFRDRTFAGELDYHAEVLFHKQIVQPHQSR